MKKTVLMKEKKCQALTVEESNVAEHVKRIESFIDSFLS